MFSGKILGTLRPFILDKPQSWCQAETVFEDQTGSQELISKHHKQSQKYTSIKQVPEVRDKEAI